MGPYNKIDACVDGTLPVSRKELVLKAHGGYRGPSTRRDRPQADDPDSLRV